MLHLSLTPHRSSVTAPSATPQKVFVLAKLRVDDEVRPETRARVLFVIDTSGSMQDLADVELAQRDSAPLSWWTRMDWAVEGLHHLIDRPQEGDRLGIVRFDQDAEVVLPLSAWSERDAAHRAANSLRRVRGETAMARGLAVAFRELEADVSTDASRVILLTDGDSPDGDQCRHWAARLAHLRVPIVALGIGTDYREDLLLELCAMTGGRTWHLASMDMLDAVLSRELDQVRRESLSQVQLSIQAKPGVQLESCSLVYPQLRELPMTATEVSLGALGQQQELIFLMDWCVDPLAAVGESVRLGPVTLHATDVSGRKLGLDSVEVVLPGVEGKPEVNDEVLGYMQQRAVDRMITNVVDLSASQPLAALEKLAMAEKTTRALGNRDIEAILKRAREQLKDRGRLEPGLAKELKMNTRTQTIRITGDGASRPAHETRALGQA